MPDDPTVAERAVVVQLLERTRSVSPVELYAAVRKGITPTAVDQAVRSLAEVGVIQDSDDGLRASAALRRLDTLRLIDI
ncbi:MAG TPA: hypothetical protein VK272_12060 [Solirubrobacteraceae bacterium]|nr:hypothetical protein [Solirubrobacteraceae bacterium]